ncbi:MAG: hypothetical protein DRG37_03810, partial [Deltaproteobacteria bacterium]
KQHPRDSKTNNRYTRARDLWIRWQKERILIKEPSPSIYYHEHSYTMGERAYTRSGIVVTVRLSEGGGKDIIPHENTYKGPKLDRLRLLTEVKANLSSIFGIYSDPSRMVTSQVKPNLEKPQMDFSISGESHRLWIIDSPEIIDMISSMVIDKTILIADGHHRYETAKTYRDRMRAVTGKKDGLQPFDYVMMYLSNIDEELSIMPTHRVIIDSMGIGLVDFEYRIKELFNMIPYDNKTTFLNMLKKGGKGHFGLLVSGIPRYYLLEPIDENAIDKFVPQSIHPLLRKLDVTILHECIIEPILGIDNLISQGRIMYTSLAEEAINMVEKGKADAAFLVNPSSIQEIIEVAKQGLKMPHKSTYFYPKIPTGLVFNPLE